MQQIFWPGVLNLMENLVYEFSAGDSDLHWCEVRTAKNYGHPEFMFAGRMQLMIGADVAYLLGLIKSVLITRSRADRLRN